MSEDILELTPPTFTPQAQTTSSFVPPECFTESNIPLPVVWDHHLEHSSEHPLFRYYEPGPIEDPNGDQSTEGNGKVVDVSWGESVRAIYRSVKIVKRDLKTLGLDEMSEIEGKPVVVGILALADVFSYWATSSGAMRAGFTPFFISPKNSPVAIAHLLKVTHCSVVYISKDEPTQTLWRETVAKHLLAEGSSPLNAFPLPEYEELWIPKEDEKDPEIEPFPLGWIDRPGLICHSSGSTSFPKPLIPTHRMLAQWALSPHISGYDCSKMKLSIHSIPSYHGMGFMTNLVWPSASGITACVFSPRATPPVADSRLTLWGAMKTKANVVLAVPLFLEEWTKEGEEIVNTLKCFDKVIWGGGPLRDSVGDHLSAQGINIGSLYGASEVGPLSCIDFENYREDWNYLKLFPGRPYHFRASGDGITHELVVLDSPQNRIVTSNTTISSTSAYATNDLLVAHPTKKGLWKVFGRSDDQIMHSSGEKTNPGPLEDIITRHPSVKVCLMFGRGELQAGILIEPIDSKKFDPKDTERLVEFRNEIWPVVEQANEYAPKHSKIFKEMILTTSPLKPFLYTMKRTVRRQLMLKDYAPEIADAYLAVRESSNLDIPLPESWAMEDCVEFVRDVVRKLVKVAENEVGDDEDIFAAGADSLVATSIRNSILRAFRDRSVDAQGVSQNFVYSHPTVHKLGRVMSEIATNGHTSLGQDTIAETMRRLVKEYTTSFPKHNGTRTLATDEVVLVTGTTGSLGSFILKSLLDTPTVSRVYALNRPSKEGKVLLERQKKAFTDHGIDVANLENPKLMLLEADLAMRGFGLEETVFEEMKNTVTGIIHNAWRVDFNLSLESFKPLMDGMRNLIELSLGSPLERPPTIVFTSSIGTLSGWSSSDPVPERLLDDPYIAIGGGGYAQSKWVSEQMLHIAAQQTPIKSVVVRVGQMIGNRTTGSWNHWEWFPAIVQTYKIVGCLPGTEGVVTWVPVDIAGAALVDMRLWDSSFLHLVHPKPVTYTSIIQLIAKELDVPLVPYSAWLSKLNDALQASSGSVQSAKANPAFKLIEFYRGVKEVQNDAQEAFIVTRLNTEQTVKASKTLGDPEIPRVVEEDVKRWLEYWQKKGVLELHGGHSSSGSGSE